MPNTNTWEQPCRKADVLNNVMTEVEHKIEGGGRERKRIYKCDQVYPGNVERFLQ